LFSSTNYGSFMDNQCKIVLNNTTVPAARAPVRNYPTTPHPPNAFINSNGAGNIANMHPFNQPNIVDGNVQGFTLPQPAAHTPMPNCPTTPRPRNASISSNGFSNRSSNGASNFAMMHPSKQSNMVHGNVQGYNIPQPAQPQLTPQDQHNLRPMQPTDVRRAGAQFNAIVPSDYDQDPTKYAVILCVSTLYHVSQPNNYGDAIPNAIGYFKFGELQRDLMKTAIWDAGKVHGVPSRGHGMPISLGGKAYRLRAYGFHQSGSQSLVCYPLVEGQGWHGEQL
jgi:hypothetical protein